MILYSGKLHDNMQPTSSYQYKVTPLKDTNHCYSNVVPLKVV